MLGFGVLCRGSATVVSEEVDIINVLLARLCT
jgi:hypothetical protein